MKQIIEYAKLRGIHFEQKENNKIKAYIKFLADNYWHEASVIIWWEKLDGKFRYWTDTIFDGRHHITGNGFGGYRYYPTEQETVTKKQLIDIIKKRIDGLCAYKQFEYR